MTSRTAFVLSVAPCKSECKHTEICNLPCNALACIEEEDKSSLTRLAQS